MLVYGFILGDVLDLLAPAVGDVIFPEPISPKARPVKKEPFPFCTPPVLFENREAKDRPANFKSAFLTVALVFDNAPSSPSAPAYEYSSSLRFGHSIVQFSALFLSLEQPNLATEPEHAEIPLTQKRLSQKLKIG